MPTPVALESLMGHTIRDVLEDWCINNVDDDDLTKAAYALLGKPTKELRSRIVVSVHMQHPLGPDKDQDHNVMGPPRSEAERPLKFPGESIGGARWEMVFGAIQVRIREDLPHKDAMNTVAVVVDRIKSGINRDSRLRALRDDLNNVMVWIETFRHSGHAAGGGNVSIFIRWVDFRAVVVSSNVRE